MSSKRSKEPESESKKKQQKSSASNTSMEIDETKESSSNNKRVSFEIPRASTTSTPIAHKKKEWEGSIVCVPVEEDFSVPFLANFHHLPPRCLTSDEVKPLEFQSYQSKEEKKKFQHMLHCETSKIEYKGSSFGPAAFKNLYSYHIGVFDKRSKELKLVPAIGIVPVNQKLKGLNESGQLDESIIEASMTAKDQKQRLVTELGGRRAKRKATQAQQNLITAQSSTISDSVKEILQEKAEEVETLSQTGFEDLPNPNFEATDPKDIYPLTNIISPAIRDVLLDAKLLLKESQDDDKFKTFIKEKNLSELFYDFMTSSFLQDMKEGPQKDSLAHVFLYLSYLVSLKSAFGSYKELKESRDKISAHTGIPPKVLELIIMEYCELRRNLVVMSSLNFAKLVNTIIILFLIAYHFKADVNGIAGILKLAPDKCAKHFKRVGCKIKQQKANVMVAQLDAPLEIGTDTLKRGAASKGRVYVTL